MLRWPLQVAIIVNVAFKWLFVLLKWLSIDLQKSDLTIFAFLSCLVNLMGFFICHFDFKFFSSLAQMPIKFNWLRNNLTKNCFFPKDAKRANWIICRVAFHFKAVEMIWKIADTALKAYFILNSSFSLADALNILIPYKVSQRTL